MTKKVRRTQNRPHVAGRTPTASTGRDKAAMCRARRHRRPGFVVDHPHLEQPDWTIDDLVAAKDGRTVSVVLPALNEEETVADVIATIRPLLGTLVDELIVLDSGSTDATVERARAAGAEVISREDAVPELEPVKGKGEVLWRSIAVATGDIIAFVDSDLIDPDPMFVPKMLGPCW